jgi:hypothetical protein
VLFVSSVVADPADLDVAAVAKVAAPAFSTRAVVASVPPDANTLTLGPCRDPVPQRVDDAGDFVPGNPRIPNPGHQAFFGEDVTVADATGPYLDTNFSCSGLWYFALYDRKVCSRLGHLHRFHRPHRDTTRPRHEPLL